MKTFPRIQTRTAAGSVLITTLLVAVLLGTVLASYLLMVRGQNVSVARSQAWHAALAVAEAGVEEALAQLNPGALTTNVPTGRGWVLDDGVYRPDPPERELLGGRYAVSYSAGLRPTIYSTGYVTLPISSTTIARVIRVETTNAALYQLPLTAQKLEKSSNRQFLTNSYNSTNPQYVTPTNSGAGIAGPAALPDVLPPFETGWPLPAKVGGKYTLSQSGDYMIPGDLALGTNETIYVTTNRTAKLYVKGDVTMDSAAKLELAPGGSLHLFVGGDNTTLGPIINSGRATNFQYFGLPANTNISMIGRTNSLVGTIYAPNATLTTTSTSAYYDFFGALTVNTFTLRRNFRLHFDENLINSGPRRGFVATSWREL